jgi:hypothetical protein
MMSEEASESMRDSEKSVAAILIIVALAIVAAFLKTL